eukprot:536213-Prymnesium_polylepis.1
MSEKAKGKRRAIDVIQPSPSSPARGQGVLGPIGNMPEDAFCFSCGEWPRICAEVCIACGGPVLQTSRRLRGCSVCEGRL